MPTGSQRRPGAVAQEIAAILDRHIADARIKQAELAEATGISQSQISKILRGEKNYTLDQLYDLAGAVGLNALEVMREAEAVVRARENVRRGVPASRADVHDAIMSRPTSASSATDDEGDEAQGMA